MPLIESESLVLKSYSLAEADKIVVLLTRDHGVIRGVAKGAKRLKSRFGSGLEPFSVVNLTYFQKETIELVSIQRIDLLESSFGAAGNPEFLNKFTYLTELLTAFMPPHDPNETLYRMTRACLDAARADGTVLAAIGVYFELWLLRLAGFMPDWDTCRDCRRPFTEDESASVTGDQHLLCQRCRRAAGGAILSGPARMLAASVRRMPPQEFAREWAPAGEHLMILSSILRQVASRSLGREVAGEMRLASTL